jgi:Flp pilus assembly protein TadG
MSRIKKSGGQALVMVTIALVAMAGMMGLAVDLGWSFFVQKQAQAAADGAALAAVQEAVARLRGAGLSVTGVTCGASADCETNDPCASLAGTTSNLNNGCQYALRNGFNWTANSKQYVWMSSGVTTPPPTAPGVKNIGYWVTVRTWQQIPQLFSAVLGNTTGVISAVSTAAIAGALAPGNLYGMNQKGDCAYTTGKNGTVCGVDLITGTGQGGTNCPGISPTVKGSICAPAGIILGSSCNASQAGVCDDGGLAGDATSGAGVETGSLTLSSVGPPVGSKGAIAGDFHDSTGAPITPSYSSNPATFQDPTQGTKQPPLQTASQIASCGLLNGNIPNGTVAGPYQYYAYNIKDASNVPKPTGNPINISGNVTFSASGACPGVTGAGAVQSGPFPTYIFYGGVNQSGTTSMEAGQYVFAGVQPGANNGGSVLYANGTMQGVGTGLSMGTMFIFTDAYYPGLNGPSGQINAIPNLGLMPPLDQGTLTFKNAEFDLNGLVSSFTGSGLPQALDVYTGIAWWQDRRNSTIEYNKDYTTDYSYIASPACASCTGDDGTVVNCYNCSSGKQTAAELAENHVVDNTLTGVVLQPGNVTLNINGVWYQPRGAFIEILHGTGSLGGTLQVITGAVIEDTGDTALLLQGPTNPIVTYKTTLIQ